MAVTVVTKDNFQSEVLDSKQKVLVDFWASWCGPCRMLTPVVHQVADENQGFKVCSINVDEQPELAAQFGVMSIPTLIVFENGKAVRQSVGVIPKEQILSLVKG
ncbi:MAG: thioredoxin [Lachnospiraceae bacterium]